MWYELEVLLPENIFVLYWCDMAVLLWSGIIFVMQWWGSGDRFVRKVWILVEWGGLEGKLWFLDKKDWIVLNRWFLVAESWLLIEGRRWWKSVNEAWFK